MPEAVQSGWDWVLAAWERVEAVVSAHAWIGWGLGILSVITLVVSVLFIPRLIAGLPADHYLEDHTQDRGPKDGAGAWLGTVARNALGAVLVLAGLAMLVLPGQGLLTLLAGLALMSFPGKRRIEIRLLRTPGLAQAVAWMRARAGVAPLRFEPRE